MSNVEGRLLVVDFDYFFPNPMLSAKPSRDVLAYDWQHMETEFHVGDVWYTRVTPFWANGLELPRALPFDGFWDRFGILETGLPLMVGDSNLFAGRIMPSLIDSDAEGWEEVWLFDAHHDSGYKATRSLEQFLEKDTMSCEDWMLNHAARGSRLHVRYPSWRANEDGSLYDCEPPPAVEVDRAVDDGQPVEGYFDAAYLCRSGAWVPPWNDDAFWEFAESYAWNTPLWIDEHFPSNRNWDEAAAREHHEITVSVLQRFRP